MEIISAVNIGIALANAGMDLLMKSGAVSALIAKAQSEGRTTLTDAEWKEAVSIDDVGKKKLDDAIASAS